MRLLAALLAVALCGTARAQDGVLTGTMKTVHDRQMLLMGVRESSLPFAFRNQAGQAVGFSVDLCMGIAADLARAINLDLLPPEAPSWQTGLRVQMIPVAADARIPKLLSGEIDLECGSTTATDERAKTVAFSPVFFLAGTKLLVPLAGGAASYRDLAGKSVAVSAGTTNAEVMRSLAKRATPAFTVTETPDLPTAYDMVASNQAAAFASDDILLAGMLATRPDGSKFVVVGDYLSYEPYAIMFRRDDPAFAELITASFQRMAQEGMLRSAYNRWFTAKLPGGQTLNLPMSAHLSEIYRAMGEPD